MPYAEIHAKTNLSFLEGASHPGELVRRAAELEYVALAITDRNSLAGVVRAHGVAKDIGLKLLVGAEITPQDAPSLVLLATDRAAYGRLARLITQGRRRAEKGACEILLRDVAEHAEGLIAAVMAGEERVGQGGQVAQVVQQYREIFADRCYLLAELHQGPDDRRRLAYLDSLSRQTGVPLVAAGDVHYHIVQRQALHDVLVAIRHGCTVASAGAYRFANAQRHLKSSAQMAAQFAKVPCSLNRTIEIADRCTFSLAELRYEYPEELAPDGQTPMEYLARLSWAGARDRYPDGVPGKVRQLVEHELQLIEELHYEAYFLTVWDLVRFARRREILCQGRGSAANSAVCYCLGITSVDPERMDVLFERFISRERNEAPDIDVDFEHQRREEVLQYLYEKYGRDRAGMTAEVITYRPRSAIRDVGKALGLSLDRVDAVAKRVEHFHAEPELDQRCREAGIDPDSAIGKQFVTLVTELVGFPRHLSQHTGGMVMTAGPLCELVPIENAAMPERTVIQWNKDDLDELGILKVDCLALGMLTAIRRCFELVEQHHGRKLTLANIPEGDADVYAMIGRADTIGVFQIESRAQMSMLPRLRPKCFYDLVIEVAIVRPGPIQGNMVHPYLRRRNGEETVTYPSEAVREVLEKTLGVPLFQEQAMRLAVVAAGFTPGQADQLRRAMGAWRRPGLIDEFRKKLIDGMLGNGFSMEYAEAVFGQIRGFGAYGFPESHAASFALLVYVSAWLKCHYPAAFTAALLNSQPMGFYAPAQLVRDARSHGVEVLPVDVNHSGYDCLLESNTAGDISPGQGGKSQGWPRHFSAIGVATSLASSENVSPLRSNKSFRPGCRTSCGCATRTLLRMSLPEMAESSAQECPGHPAQALRLGLNQLHGLAADHARRIEQVRGERPFRSMEDFAKRTGLTPAVMSRLARAGIFESLQLKRREALWDAIGQDQKELPLFDAADREPEVRAAAELPELSAAEEVLADYRTCGLSLRAHPVAFLRQRLAQRRVVPADQLSSLPDGKPVRVAGIVLVRQRPGTAKGITFITLEDETGVANLIVRSDVWRRFRQAALGATLMLAAGRLQRQGQVIHIRVNRLENLSTWMEQMVSQSRDFR